ncbi:LAMI_0G06942g1_1 [Lachancea mirantina]|uniref:LAMI_0G06942g1_1 n=1 Tax=Lachancea mirantina TaxID=1230905 RepID=A0A1G4K9C7_9SACH|nr:LAMI_0G06942g1_1 [Lachancea mirantina]
MSAVLHSHLLLASPADSLDALKSVIDGKLLNFSRNILAGESYRNIDHILGRENFLAKSVVSSQKQEPDYIFKQLLDEFVSVFSADNELMLILAISLLQTFIQNNFTGPSTPYDGHESFLSCLGVEDQFKEISLRLLSVSGQPVYELCDRPEYLAIALGLFEKLTNSKSLILNEFLAEDESEVVEISASETSVLRAASLWWRSRALLTQLALLPQVTGSQPILASSILDSPDLVLAIAKEFPSSSDAKLQRDLAIIFYLERARCSLALGTENLCHSSLLKAQKLTGLQFILTGARAKRTKYQEKVHSELIILASSSGEFKAEDNQVDNPVTFDLQSEYLLEKPQYEDIGMEPLNEQIIKRQKHEAAEMGFNDEFLPVAERQEEIPIVLKELDPNDQPQLHEYDSIQLLLRLYTIRQTSPAGDLLVQEELLALLSRILHQKGHANWTVFSRSLWERSMIETNRAKTIERGIIQMQSLVEELGLMIDSKFIPQGTDESTANPSKRLQYVHQLPLLPRWSLDIELAEKYMSIGVLMSAVEIYERLSCWCEAALCYAAVGQEKRAEEILLSRIEQNPNDCRAYSILGDVRQDPQLWLKSWEIGRYVNAKNSLASYYYNPPTSSGLAKDLPQALGHLNDSLRAYPLSFETWYFYGCMGLEDGNMNLAAEAFSRCTALDDRHSQAWSNLAAAYFELGKLKEAHNCLKKAVRSDSDNKWRIWENLMLVSLKLNEWNDVLMCCKRLVNMRRNNLGEKAIDLPIIEKLVELLIDSDYSENLNYFQNSCIELICVTLPTIITTDYRCWKLIARVELWRRRPWASLDCQEKAFRAISHDPNMEVDEQVWNETVDACEDLIAAYESLGEMEGKHGAGDLVCRDWKYKARNVIKSLMGRGKSTMEDSDGWFRLQDMRDQL